MRILNRRWLIGSFCVVLWTNAVRAEDKQAITDSVKRAIEYLKKNALGDRYAPQASMPTAMPGGGGLEEGPAVLAAIALLEADVPASDPVVQKIAGFAREAAVKQAHTYQLALDIILLDKLGEQIDTTLIQSMGARLLVGQTANGGWTYGVPLPDDEEQNRLRNLLKGATLKGTTSLPKDPNTIKSRPPLDPAVEDMLKNQRFKPNPAMMGGMSDNSNTQFAFIALWSARKHGVPVEKALKLAEDRFRKTQVITGNLGGWGYVPAGPRMATPSMTCVGLLSLAVVSGLRGEARMKGGIIKDGVFKPSAPEKSKAASNPLDDHQVRLGLNFLGATLAAHRGLPNPNARGQPGQPATRGGGMRNSADPRDDLYFMWCLERVGMVFNIGKIGSTDWHEWGSAYLLRTQRNDGSWMSLAGTHPTAGPLADTSFGLMFMCRSNIIRDLSKVLKATADLDKMKPSAPRVGANDKGTSPKSNSDLVKNLVQASADRKAELINEYVDAKGGSYTIALAEAIPQLPKESQKKAIEGLAYRMARLTPKSLSAYLAYDNAEIRRAACYAVYMSDHRQLVPKLIKAIEDSEEIVCAPPDCRFEKCRIAITAPRPGTRSPNARKRRPSGTHGGKRSRSRLVISFASKPWPRL